MKSSPLLQLSNMVPLEVFNKQRTNYVWMFFRTKILFLISQFQFHRRKKVIEVWSVFFFFQVNYTFNFAITLCVQFKKNKSQCGSCVYMVCCSHFISIYVLVCVQYMRMLSFAAQRESSISCSCCGTYTVDDHSQQGFAVHVSLSASARSERVRIIFTSRWQSLFLFTFNPFPTVAVTPRKTEQKRSPLVL